MSTITIPHPAPAAPHIGCDTDADFAAIVEIGFDQVLTAPDGSTKYLASSVALTPDQIADWCHPKSTPGPNGALATDLLQFRLAKTG
jgi:hypothetical protein